MKHIAYLCLFFCIFFSINAQQTIVIDLGIMIYPNYEKITKLVKKRAGLLKSPSSIISTALTASKMWWQNKNIEDELERLLDNFLLTIRVPPSLHIPPNEVLSGQNRQKGTMKKYAPIFCAFLHSPDKKTEKAIRDLVIKAFHNTDLEEIRSLSKPFQKALEESLKIMFSSDDLLDLLEIDPRALALIENIRKTHHILLIHNFPGTLDLTKLHDKNTPRLAQLIKNIPIYNPSKQGFLTTDQAFYQNLDLGKTALLITIDTPSKTKIRKTGLFNKLILYDYKHPNKIEKDLFL